jgi:hypothetical protein
MILWDGMDFEDLRRFLPHSPDEDRRYQLTLERSRELLDVMQIRKARSVLAARPGTVGDWFESFMDSLGDGGEEASDTERYFNFSYFSKHYSSRKCFDRRDYVYALLQLDNRLELKKQLHPDYTIELPELFVRSALGVLQAPKKVSWQFPAARLAAPFFGGLHRAMKEVSIFGLDDMESDQISAVLALRLQLLTSKRAYRQTIELILDRYEASNHDPRTLKSVLSMVSTSFLARHHGMPAVAGADTAQGRQALRVWLWTRPSLYTDDEQPLDFAKGVWPFRAPDARMPPLHEQEWNCVALQAPAQDSFQGRLKKLQATLKPDAQWIREMEDLWRRADEGETITFPEAWNHIA